MLMICALSTRGQRMYDSPPYFRILSPDFTFSTASEKRSTYNFGLYTELMTAGRKYSGPFIHLSAQWSLYTHKGDVVKKGGRFTLLLGEDPSLLTSTLSPFLIGCNSYWYSSDENPCSLSPVIGFNFESVVHITTGPNYEFKANGPSYSGFWVNFSIKPGMFINDSGY